MNILDDMEGSKLSGNVNSGKMDLFFNVGIISPVKYAEEGCTTHTGEFSLNKS